MVMAVCAIDTFLLITVNIYELLTKCEVKMAGYLAKFCVPFHGPQLVSVHKNTREVGLENLEKFGEFGIGSTNNPLIDIFLYSHYFSA